MSEGEDINFDVSASRWDYRGWTLGKNYMKREILM